MYDSPDYLGIARVVRSGQNLYIDGNASSVDLKPASASAPANPTVPFEADANTVHLYHFNEGSGSVLGDSVGSLNGTIASGVSWASGKFGSGLYFPNPTDGAGVTFGTMDVCPMSWEGWVRRYGNGGRIAGQLGGGGNTGANKWLLYLNDRRPYIEVWSGGGSQIAYSNEVIEDTTDWHYIMWTYDCGTNLKLYLDNELVGETTTAGVWNTGATTFEIGAAEGIGRCNCDIDEVRVSNTVRVPVAEPEPTPTPVPTVIPTPVPTATPQPTPTPVPTETPVPSEDLQIVNARTTDGDWNPKQALLKTIPLGGYSMSKTVQVGIWKLN